MIRLELPEPVILNLSEDIYKKYTEKRFDGYSISTFVTHAILYEERYHKLKKEYEELKAENEKLKARLEKTVELPCKVGDEVHVVDKVDVELFKEEMVSIWQK